MPSFEEMGLKNPLEIMKEAEQIFNEREAVYGTAGYKKHGEILAILFPNGLSLKTVDDFNRWTIFNQMLGKFCRYAENIEKGGHHDSAVDIGNYAFILAANDIDARKK